MGETPMKSMLTSFPRMLHKGHDRILVWSEDEMTARTAEGYAVRHCAEAKKAETATAQAQQLGAIPRRHDAARYQAFFDSQKPVAAVPVPIPIPLSPPSPVDVIPVVPTLLQRNSRDALEREVELAEQLHRDAVQHARQRKAADAKAARARDRRKAERLERQREQARAWRAIQQAEAAERARWREVGKLSDEVAQRRVYQVSDTYAVNFRETYVEDAYYLDAIEPYTWR